MRIRFSLLKSLGEKKSLLVKANDSGTRMNGPLGTIPLLTTPPPRCCGEVVSSGMEVMEMRVPEPESF